MNPTLIRLQVLDNGWHPIAVDGKAAAVPGWQRYCTTAPTPEEVERWERRYPGAQSTGIALGRQVAIDIDVLSDPALAQQLRAEAVSCFGSTPFVRVGRAPKLALIYRAAEPIPRSGSRPRAATGTELRS